MAFVGRVTDRLLRLPRCPRCGKTPGFRVAEWLADLAARETDANRVGCTVRCRTKGCGEMYVIRAEDFREVKEAS